MVELLSGTDYTLPKSNIFLLPSGSDDRLAAGGPYYPPPGATVTFTCTGKVAANTSTMEFFWQKSKVTPKSGAAINQAAVFDYGVISFNTVLKDVTKTLVVPADYDGAEPFYLGVLSNSGTNTALLSNASMQGPARATAAPAPPTPPTNLRSSNITQWSARIDFTAGTGAILGYNLYRNGTKVNAELLTGTVFTDTTLNPGTSYTYTARSVGPDSLSEESVPLVVTTAGQAPDPEPEPEPEPEPGDGETEPEPGDGTGEPTMPTVSEAAKRVADFLGLSDDLAFLALAQESVTVVTAMVHAYTRGNGFAAGQPNNELSAVITTASARLVANPEQLATDVGTVSTRGGFNAFSLAETFVLNRYRVRAR